MVQSTITKISLLLNKQKFSGWILSSHINYTRIRLLNQFVLIKLDWPWVFGFSFSFRTCLSWLTWTVRSFCCGTGRFASSKIRNSFRFPNPIQWSCTSRDSFSQVVPIDRSSVRLMSMTPCKRQRKFLSSFHTQTLPC